MLVLVAFALTAIIGITGLAVDFGFAAVERRTLQKAADAAAMSGALDLADSSTWGSIGTDVSTMVTRNTVPAGTATVCTLVDNANNQVQENCNTPSDNNTSGVKVVLSHPYQTYFMRVLGISTVPISASAIGRIVMQNEYEGGNALFIVCGDDTKLTNGSTMDILSGSSPNWSVNPSAVGKTFVVHNSNGGGLAVSDCNAPSAKFKGLADADANAGLTTMPTVMDFKQGTRAGPTRTAVEGPNGCAGNLNSDGLPSCVMLLPIADYHIGGAPSTQMHTVMWLPFLITQVDANTHYGQLISDKYVLRLETTSTSNWTLQHSGLLAARLVR